MENDNQTNQENEDKNKHDIGEEITHLIEEMVKMRKQINNLSCKINELEQRERNFDSLSKQILVLEQEKENLRAKQEKELLRATWKKGLLILAIFMLCTLFLFIMAAICADDPHISLPFIIGGVSSLLIMAIVVIVFVRQTRDYHTHYHPQYHNGVF